MPNVIKRIPLNPPPPEFRILAWDPAPGRGDWSALVGQLWRLGADVPVHVTYADRLPQGMEWPDQIGEVQRIIAKVRPDRLVIDASGVGSFAVDEVYHELGRPWDFLVAITSHAGYQAKVEGRHWSIPKTDLIQAAQSLVEHKRLKYNPKLALGALLRSEMAGFRKATTPTGKPRYGNDVGPIDWRRSANDDLVLALAMACYVGTQMERSKRDLLKALAIDLGEVNRSLWKPSRW